jgi:hypothetical protein
VHKSCGVDRSWFGTCFRVYTFPPIVLIGYAVCLGKDWGISVIIPRRWNLFPFVAYIRIKVVLEPLFTLTLRDRLVTLQRFAHSLTIRISTCEFRERCILISIITIGFAPFTNNQTLSTRGNKTNKPIKDKKTTTEGKQTKQQTQRKHSLKGFSCLKHKISSK